MKNEGNYRANKARKSRVEKKGPDRRSTFYLVVYEYAMSDSSGLMRYGPKNIKRQSSRRRR